MKKIQEEAKAALGKAQEEMKRWGDRKRGKGEEYKIGDIVLLSTKDLKWQMKGRRSEKLTECFVGPYKVRNHLEQRDRARTTKLHQNTPCGQRKQSTTL